MMAVWQTIGLYVAIALFGAGLWLFINDGGGW